MQPMAPTRVPPYMKRLGLVVAALALVGGALWYLDKPDATSAKADSAPPPAPAATSAPPRPSAAPAPKPVDKVTKLANDAERQQLADRIASAQSARAAVRAAPLPRLPDQPEPAPAQPVGKTEIRAAMKEVVPFLADCYERAIPLLASADFDLNAQLALVGDPEVGTLVEVKSLVDGDGKALIQQLDDCFKNALQLLALPPLAEGDRIEVRYPFKFRQEPAK